MTGLRAVDIPEGPAEREALPSTPEYIELRESGHRLHLRWPDGFESALSAATLRNACRCAACTNSRRNGPAAPVAARIALDQVAEFGIVGLQLVFSDGHRRGIFPWAYLRQLAGP